MEAALSRRLRRVADHGAEEPSLSRRLHRLADREQRRDNVHRSCVLRPNRRRRRPPPAHWCVLRSNGRSLRAVLRSLVRPAIQREESAGGPPLVGASCAPTGGVCGRSSARWCVPGTNHEEPPRDTQDRGSAALLGRPARPPDWSPGSAAARSSGSAARPVADVADHRAMEPTLTCRSLRLADHRAMEPTLTCRSLRLADHRAMEPTLTCRSLRLANHRAAPAAGPQYSSPGIRQPVACAPRADEDPRGRPEGLDDRRNGAARPLGSSRLMW